MSLAGRTVLVTGGTSGTGLAVATAAHRLGAAVIIGSRSRQSFTEAAAQFGGEGVSPFIADLGDLDSLEAAFDDLELSLHRPTDIVHAAAGGLESILRPLLRTTGRLRRMPAGPERDAEMERGHDEIARLVKQDSERAFAVNDEGPRWLLDRVARLLPDGGRIIGYSSLWSEGVRRGECPAFYRSIAESKMQFEDWLEEAARDLWAPRLRVAMIVGHLISDTAMGRLIDRNLLPLMPPEVAGPFQAGYVTIEQTAAATMGLLTGDLEPGALRRFYLIGSENLTTTPDPKLMAVVGRMPL